MAEGNCRAIVMNNSLEIIIVFDRTGTIILTNRMAEEELGYDGRMDGANISSVFIKEFEEESGCESVMTLIGSRKNAVCYRRNGTCFRAKVRICFEELTGEYYLFALNTEANCELEHEIHMVRGMAEQAMDVRNDFVANVTHELRTPVNGIRGHVENLKDTSLTMEQRRTLEIIESCCGNMSALINDILDFSKLEAGRIELEEEKFEIRETVDKVSAAHMASVNEKGLRLSVNVDENIPRFLMGDELRLTQILNNLLSNAVKFTSVGFVKVEVTQTLRFNDEIELFFMVSDSGIGIAKEDQDKLFHSFSQVDASITRRYGGTGLGLVIARELVELMNGRIYLESEKGRGSNFSFSVRMHVLEDDARLLEYKRDVEEFMKSRLHDGEEDVEECYRFGSEQNRGEIGCQMEKLVLCIELNAWEKAEQWLEELKRLVEGADEEVKRTLLRLGMAIRKENYDSSMKNYETVKMLLEKKSGEQGDGNGEQ